MGIAGRGGGRAGGRAGQEACGGRAGREACGSARRARRAGGLRRARRAGGLRKRAEDVRLGSARACGGGEVARRLRELEKDFLLVFITGYDNYMLESFEVLPFRYVLKPIDSEKLEPILQQIMIELEHHMQYLFYKVGKKHCQLRIRDIVVISSELGRKVRVDLVDKRDAQFYFKLKKLLKLLPNSHFFQINRGIIINMNYITGIIGDQITLENGMTVYISRGNRKKFKQAYTEFSERSMGI